ncbi:MAG: FISUMP domain-containing protein [Patescibacteria group bacterium]
MVQIPQPTSNQGENKSSINIPSASPVIPPGKSVSSAQANDSKSVINMNTQHSGQQFKLASTEMQGPKQPLVNGKGSKFALIAAASILVIIVGIGGYYFFTKDNNFQPISSPAAVLPTAAPVFDKNLDSDLDGLPDAIEKVLGANINNSDSDDDTFLDLAEIKSGYSPLIAGGAGKYTEEEWDNVKGKIKIEDRDFYEREFGMPLAPSQSPSPEASLTPSQAPSQAPLSFTCGASTVSDIDSNIYNTVQIGEQCWLKENLKVTKNPAGEAITRYCYDDDPKICDTDGGLYDWNTAMNKSTTEGGQGICPNGWHVPKDSEWYALENGLKDNGQTCDAKRSRAGDCATAGTKLSLNGSSGFEGIFTGGSGITVSYIGRGKFTGFLSSTENGDGIDIWTRSLISDKTTVDRDVVTKVDYISVRCLKD